MTKSKIVNSQPQTTLEEYSNVSNKYNYTVCMYDLIFIVYIYHSPAGH